MSIRKAVNEKCKDCIYDPLAGGTWRAQVEACIATDCALYPYRPVTRRPKEGPKQPQPEHLRRHREASE